MIRVSRLPGRITSRRGCEPGAALRDAGSTGLVIGTATGVWCEPTVDIEYEHRETSGRVVAVCVAVGCVSHSRQRSAKPQRWSPIQG